MPSSVADVFSAAGLVPTGVVQWGVPLPETTPGVYVVALTERTDRIEGTRTRCPLSESAVDELLRIRPELRIDGARPGPAQLRKRLAALWLGDETILYVGLAGTSLEQRVSAYYRTPIGARRPHAGGWPLKTLTVLPALWVHYAPCANPVDAELAMLDAFIERCSRKSRQALHDPGLPIPFANLERAKGETKRHGITGAREPRQQPAARVDSRPDLTGTDEARHPAVSKAPPRTRPWPGSPAGPMRSQRVTEKDIQAGRVRFPSSAKPAFPSERVQVEVLLRGHSVVARWHPHYDPDQERSGVLTVGRQLLGRHVAPDEVLAVSEREGYVALD